MEVLFLDLEMLCIKIAVVTYLCSDCHVVLHIYMYPCLHLQYTVIVGMEQMNYTAYF